MNLAEMTKNVRKVLGLNQYELAKLIGTNQTKISFIENGFIPPQKEIIEEIISLYNKNK